MPASHCRNALPRLETSGPTQRLNTGVSTATPILTSSHVHSSSHTYSSVPVLTGLVTPESEWTNPTESLASLVHALPMLSLDQPPLRWASRPGTTQPPLD